MAHIPMAKIEAPSGGSDSKRLPPFIFVAAEAKEQLWTYSN